MQKVEPKFPHPLSSSTSSPPRTCYLRLFSSVSPVDSYLPALSRNCFLPFVSSTQWTKLTPGRKLKEKINNFEKSAREGCPSILKFDLFFMAFFEVF
ncbi:hypothetical protein TSAR_001704 [Trichomalopsis sarcophagae]|uniref:Uncharacterized protein n=1 Tax=Trichomalopsis sarcophagae TaxID=543379 RepID=A0A232FHN2_9HYME|nr:hypothetical protein TSAR_001704 [Trichomalopsis sarcophagae]